MNKIFPNRYIIHVAEDLRLESGDKMSIMGLSQKGIELIEHNDKFVIPSLAVYGLFYGVRGDFDGKITIESRDGEKVLEAPLPVTARDDDDDDSSESDIDPKHSKLLVAGKFMNVYFKTAARCKVTISLDDQEYSDYFSLRKPKKID
ncbi:hypothetical protein SOX05_15215 [Pseudomonas putida]|nr:hypothetical protein [Pseudomonas putida]MDY4320818.1 hypothetical protein [Pseudomonas putida]MDY4354083.1 hypothetical protein [Pseudomonas putida]